MSSLSHTYGYVGESAVAETGSGHSVKLATSGGVQANPGSKSAPGSATDHPYFFQGALTQPRITAQALWVLSNVVASRFTLSHEQKMAMRDPVVTSGGDLLRFEGFSGCCGVYARVDLEAEAYDGVVTAHGTTNVDFNAPMRNALARIRERESVSFAVGDEEVTMIRGSEQVVERKVKLPVRWLKGFVEVQAYKARMIPRLEIDRVATVRFLRTIPPGIRGKSEAWIVPAGPSLRVAGRAARDGVRVAGLERLRLLEPLAPLAKGLRIYVDDQTGETSAWELNLGSQRFTLVLSPDNYRGFSGEGQVLHDLVSPGSEELLDQARASLKWQAALKTEEFVGDWDVPEKDVRGALALLGTRGLVGFDLSRAAYFHREMPFDMSAVEALHPRLKAARELIDKDDDSVRILAQTPEKIVGEVAGSKQVTHRVTLFREDDEFRCTCHWFTKFQGARGRCKHALAVQILSESDGER